MSYNNIIPSSLLFTPAKYLSKNKCRNCKHSRFDHSNCSRKGKRPCIWIKDLTNPRPNLDCKCKNFESLDNLEYLEQKYNQK